MARRIFLRRKGISEEQAGTIQGWRMEILAHDAEGLQNEIFVYRVQIVDANLGTQKATFQNIASAADLEELPIDGVTEDSSLLFLKSTIDLVFRSVDTMNTVWEDIQRDVGQLIATLNALDDLEVIEDVLIGAPEEEGVSSSSSA